MVGALPWKVFGGNFEAFWLKSIIQYVVRKVRFWIFILFLWQIKGKQEGKTNEERKGEKDWTCTPPCCWSHCLQWPLLAIAALSQPFSLLLLPPLLLLHNHECFSKRAMFFEMGKGLREKITKWRGPSPFYKESKSLGRPLHSSIYGFDLWISQWGPSTDARTIKIECHALQ